MPQSAVYCLHNIMLDVFAAGFAMYVCSTFTGPAPHERIMINLMLLVLTKLTYRNRYIYIYIYIYIYTYIYIYPAMRAYTRVFIYIALKLGKFQYVIGGAIYGANRR
jgi:hypothetical protein